MTTKEKAKELLSNYGSWFLDEAQRFADFRTNELQKHCEADDVLGSWACIELRKSLGDYVPFERATNFDAYDVETRKEAYELASTGFFSRWIREHTKGEDDPLDMHPDAVTARKYMAGDPQTVRALEIFDED